VITTTIGSPGSMGRSQAMHSGIDILSGSKATRAPDRRRAVPGTSRHIHKEKAGARKTDATETHNARRARARHEPG
jgi:hypothetical protein